MSEDQVAINPEFLWTTKWWAFGGRFPLIPVLRTRAADRWNTRSFYFQWLGFRIWTMDSVDTGIEITANDSDFMIRMRVPYLIAGFWLPIFPSSFSQKYWRKPPREESNDHA